MHQVSHTSSSISKQLLRLNNYACMRAWCLAESSVGSGFIKAEDLFSPEE